MNAHVTQSRLDRYWLVGHDPNWAATGLIHLHGETHGCIDGMDAARLELGHDRRAHFVDLFTGSVDSRLATERGAPRTGSRAMRTTKLSSDLVHG